MRYASIGNGVQVQGVSSHKFITGADPMTDQTDALLSELVDLQRRALANQERALAHQEQSLLRLQASARRARSVQWMSWIVIALVVATLFLGPVLNWIGRTR